MEIEFDLTKSIEENASDYFEKSKKAKRKLKRAKQALKELQLKLKEKGPMLKKRIKLKPRWYEQFRWFLTSNGFLCIAGKNAKQNELLVKKYFDNEDLFFHSEARGSHCILKQGAKADEESKKQAAEFAAIHSSVWPEQTNIRVYSATKEQLSKKAPSGEYIAKGAFMVYGKRQWYKAVPKFVVGVERIGNALRVIAGPKEAIEKHAEFFVELIAGDNSKERIAKRLKKLFEERFRQEFDYSEIYSMLPNGKFSLVL